MSAQDLNVNMEYAIKVSTYRIIGPVKSLSWCSDRCNERQTDAHKNKTTINLAFMKPPEGKPINTRDSIQLNLSFNF